MASGTPVVSYTPGPWVAVGGTSSQEAAPVGHGEVAGWLLIDIDPSDSIVLQAWALIRNGAQLEEILDAVLARGLRAVRSFALVRVADGQCAVVVRGAATARYTVGGQAEQVSAAGVATWREVAVPDGAGEVRIAADQPDWGTEGVTLGPGVTLATQVRLGFDPAFNPVFDAASAKADPEPVPVPVPVVESQPPEPQPSRPPEPPEPSEPPEPPEPQPSPEPGPDVPPVPAPDVPTPTPDVPEPPPTGPPASPLTGEDEPLAHIPWAQPVSDAPTAPPPSPVADPAPILPSEPVAVAPPNDTMSWLSAVKPLHPGDEPAGAVPAAPQQPAAVGWVPGGAGIGGPHDGPQPQQPPPGQPAGSSLPHPPQAGPEPAESPDSTVSRASLTDLFEPEPAGSTVQAVHCQHGHLSPPMAVSCRVCGFPLFGQAPVTVPRPVLGILRLSTGDVVPLDRGVVMGRNPKIDVDEADPARPHVVRLPSPGHDISRTHVEIRLDGWHVLITDLNSVNGTVVTPPWQEPQRLRPNEPVPIEPGTVVSVADEVSFRYEVTG